MSRCNALWTLGTTVVLSSAFLLAAPSPGGSGSGSGSDNVRPPRRAQARLTKPYSELKDLTPDERNRIIEIHQKAVDQIHEIEAQEKEKILAILTPQQQKELADIQAKDREAARERRSSARGATTQPSGGGQ